MPSYHFSYVVLENVDKAQTKIRLRKDNVAGKVFIHNYYVFQQHDLKAHSSFLMKPHLNLSANLLWFMFFSCFTPLNPKCDQHLISSYSDIAE